MQKLLIESGLQAPPPEAPFQDLDQIELVSRDMRSHPVQPGVLRLSATIVNRASRAQAYPRLEVIMTDAAGQTLVKQNFDPETYLARDADIEAGMSPEAYLPVTLDLDDPGDQAVGFELHFR